MSRRLPSLLATLAMLAAVLGVAVPAHGGGAGPYQKDWAFLLDGWNRHSSPVIADIDGDGANEVVVGHQDGKLRAYEGNGALKWAVDAIPGQGPECRTQSGPSAVDSSPAVADIDGDGTPEVVVGVGSVWRADQNGSVIAFDGRSGTIEWAFDESRDEGDVWAGGSPVDDGWCEATFATPAIGDVDGDGHLDIVFASWDFHIWAVDRFGNPLPGFPVDNDDTVWSSPALYDIDGDDDMEIFIGGDSTPGGSVDHLGGVFRAIDYRGGPVSLWNRFANEVFHSSPAIGDIDHDGRLEVVVGSGNNWHIECTRNNHPQCGPGDGSDHVRVWAFHAHDGSTVAGFPVSATDSVWASPAIGDVDADGSAEIVVGAADHRIYAWNGDGSLAWSTVPDFDHLGDGPANGHPVIADLDGDGDQDVAVGTAKGLALLDGRTGASLEDGLAWPDRMSFSWSHESAPAIGELNGSRHIVFTGFDTPSSQTRMAAYRLPDSSSDDAWPMFRQGPARQGSIDSGTVLCGFTSSGTFCDVPDGTYYTEAVEWMVDEGITTGVSDLLYGPDLGLTRGQMVTFLWRQEGSPSGHPDHGFTDVAAGVFYEQAVRWAKATGITTGTSSTSFSPNTGVTRAQLVTLLWRRAGRPAAAPPTQFVDVAPDRFYTTAVGWAVDNDITTGTSPNTFSPDAVVTRAQAAAFLWREAGSPAVR